MSLVVSRQCQLMHDFGIARTVGREGIWCTYGLITSTRASLRDFAFSFVSVVESLLSSLKPPAESLYNSTAQMQTDRCTWGSKASRLYIAPSVDFLFVYGTDLRGICSAVPLSTSI